MELEKERLKEEQLTIVPPQETGDTKKEKKGGNMLDIEDIINNTDAMKSLNKTKGFMLYKRVDKNYRCERMLFFLPHFRR